MTLKHVKKFKGAAVKNWRKNVMCEEGLTQETRMLPLSQEDTGKKTQEF